MTDDPGGVSPVAGRKLWSRRRKLFAGACLAVGAVGFLWLVSLPTFHVHGPDTASSDDAGGIGSEWKGIPRAVPVAQRVPATPPPAAPPEYSMAPQEDLAPPSRTPIAAFQAGPSSTPNRSSDGGDAGPVTRASYGSASPYASSQREGALSDETSVARMLPDRNLFITMGTPMACTPEQPINTDQPGPFRCKVTSPIWSTSGDVRLFDAGTWLVGEVSQSLARGKRRAYAVMHRAETPQGCLVSFRDPVGDTLGEAGLDGDVNEHFFERFKGYAMIALLDALSQGAALAASNAISNRNESGTNLNFNQVQGIGSQLGQSTFGDDINIPPTLSRNQAKPIVVIAASDIDMRPCFSLVAR